MPAKLQKQNRRYSDYIPDSEMFEHWCNVFDLNDENQDLEFVFCCFSEPDIYEVEAKAARESLTKPWSIWGDLLLSIKFDLQLTTARVCSSLRACDLCWDMINVMTVTNISEQQPYFSPLLIHHPHIIDQHKYSFCFSGDAKREKKVI